MNFVGHLTGGLIASVAVPVGIHSLYLSQNIKSEPNYLILGSITLGMSLFPDLDIQSTPQKWFYRFMVCFLGYYILIKKYKEAAIIGMISMIPLTDKHRGITHMWLLSIFVPIIVCFGIYYSSTNIIDIGIFIKEYHWFFICATLGWMTHLILDLF